MSRRRRKPLREWQQHVKGKNGVRYCTYCRKELTPPKQAWCSLECVHEYKIRNNSSYASECVFERDGGICAICGVDCVKRQQDGRLELIEARKRGIPDKQIYASWKAQGWPGTLKRRWWDCDHVIPVVNGGGLCGLDNLRTLCTPCHRGLTAKLATERAVIRKHKTAKRPRRKHESTNTPPPGPDELLGPGF